MDVALDVIAANAAKVDGIKISLLDKDKEIAMRRRLPQGVRMYTGDDFNYAELIAGDEQGYSDALLGIFDAIAPAASAALGAFARGDTQRVPRNPGADRAAVAPHLQGADALLQDRRGVHGVAQRPAGSFRHGRRPAERALNAASRRAVPAGRRRRAAAPIRTRRGAHAHRDGGARDRRLMRDLSNDRRLLAVNSATVKSWSLAQLVEGCARAGIPGIAPWRDIVQAMASRRPAKLIRDAGLAVTGLCRGGMFPAADEAGRRAALEDNRRAIDEAAGDRREVPGADRAAVCRRARRTSPARTRRCATASRRCCRMRAPPACRWRSSRCIR